MAREIDVRRRLPNDIAWIAGIACTGYTVLTILDRGVGVDAHAYWLAWRGPMYTTAPGTPDAYLYSPAFAQALWPLAQLPWPAFAAAFVIGTGLLLAWLVRPVGWRWAIPLWLCGLPEIVSGNIFIFMAACAVLGFRKPAFWVLPALTKVAPAVGPVWFLVRRQWRQLLVFVAVLGVIAGISYLASPELWQQWATFLVQHAAESAGPIGSAYMPPAIIRFPVGLALVIWGALGDRRWTVPVAMLLCTPVLWLGSLTLLAAIPRIRLDQGLTALPSLPERLRPTPV